VTPSSPSKEKLSLPKEASLSTPSWCPVDYAALMSYLLGLPAPDRKQQMRILCRTDLYFLLRYVMNRADMENPWLYARIKEVEKEPDGRLDLWARDHRKSSIITFALTIQDILGSHGDYPLSRYRGLELTFGIFSHTRPIAKKFLQQIMQELETNQTLIELFPDILFEKPDRNAPRWSLDAGIVVKRRSNSKDATVEAHGLIDGQPIGSHFNVLIYDDVVVPASVTGPEMIEKTTEAWGNSLNLGDSAPRQRIIGTRWHFADTYRTIMDRGAAIPRIYPATSDGTLTGDPVLLTKEQIEKKIRDMGPYIASANLLLNPIADSRQTFQRSWFERRFEPLNIDYKRMTRALICDPASKKKKNSDWTAMVVIGKSESRKVYILDFIRDRMNLQERATEYLRLQRKWETHYQGYESYGLQADIEYIKELQDKRVQHFDITELGGKIAKEDRINRLIPVCSSGDLYLPESLYRTTYEGKVEEQVIILIEQEFLAWPVPVHDDGMDVISRYIDFAGFDFPAPTDTEHRDDRYNKAFRAAKRRRSWLSA
jgi:phage terminase large subunit-like protein